MLNRVPPPPSVMHKNATGIQISILIPAYNSVKWLARAVDSVLRNKMESLEILLLDDGSSDGTWQLIESFMQSNSCVKAIRFIKNCGVSVARNYLLAEASGEWIVFLDADDFFAEGFLEFFFRFLNSEDKVDIYVTDFYTLKNGKTKLYRQFKYKVVNPLQTEDLFRMYPMSTVRFYRRAFLMEYSIDFENFRNFEDVVFWYRLIANNPKVYYLAEPLYFYQIRDNSLSEKHSKHSIQERLRAIDYLLLKILPNYISSCPALAINISQRVLKTLEIILRGSFSLKERNELFDITMVFIKHYFQELEIFLLSTNGPQISLRQHYNNLSFLSRQVYSLYKITNKIQSKSTRLAHIFLHIVGYFYRASYKIIALLINYKLLK